MELPGIQAGRRPGDSGKWYPEQFTAKRTETRSEGDEARYHLVERTYGTFERRFQLPQGVDTEKIEADVELGMLAVHIPKGALPQPKTIAIKVGTNAGRRLEKALGRENSAKRPK